MIIRSSTFIVKYKWKKAEALSALLASSLRIVLLLFWTKANAELLGSYTFDMGIAEKIRNKQNNNTFGGIGTCNSDI